MEKIQTLGHIVRNSGFRRKNLLNSIFFLVGLTSIFYILNPHIADAASLYFSPSSGEYAVGKTLSISVYVSSADQAINAASGAISFPQDKLEVVSLSKGSSIFTLWVQEPSFSNSAGSVNFEGIVLNPGFIGTSGKVITVNFRVKAAGTALLNFSSGSVLANDGRGTNILSNLGSATYGIGGAIITNPSQNNAGAILEESGANVSAISSATHPDEGAWYANSDPEFSWDVPRGTTGVRISYSADVGDKPGVFYASLRAKKLTDVPDGVWYFHIQFRTMSGWGEITHRRFQIDTEKPEYFNITSETRSDSPRLNLHLDARDKTSGVNYYEIKVDDNEPIIQEPKNLGLALLPYEVLTSGAGNHLFNVKAVDKAGNFLTQTFNITVPEIQTPPIIRQSIFGLSPTTVNLLALMALLLIILEALVFLFRYGWHKFSKHLKVASYRKKIGGKKIYEIHDEGHTINLLRREIESEVVALEEASHKRRLTKAEARILDRLRKMIGVS